MELNEFIKKSLLEILQGVRSASDEDKAIAPAAIEGKPVWTERLVEFEVNVEVDATAKSGLKVLSIVEAGGELKRVSSHRLRFSVPVHMNVKKEWS
ncbi:hypothetical protein SAMN05443999_103282 [Roseovarius azorensis]|uniref:Uncharacterized protein n=1 Tax=Roseovarius azorensis TaxID=1287727 RepID=A0A1H7MDR8_9RHOB|nr:hypothetical protein [Roseovarius azorensis]SEL09241.1 hypothetical protein SAMN05443999_103282 [Roseovarius azorensis]